jgi:chromosome segregation ATPase
MTPPSSGRDPASRSARETAGRGRADVERLKHDKAFNERAWSDLSERLAKTTDERNRLEYERDSARAKVEKSMGALREVVRWRLAETNDPFPWELLSSICALLGKKIHSLTEAREALKEGK